jgi:hypothetical protein
MLNNYLLCLKQLVSAERQLRSPALSLPASILNKQQEEEEEEEEEELSKLHEYLAFKPLQPSKRATRATGCSLRNFLVLPIAQACPKPGGMGRRTRASISEILRGLVLLERGPPVPSTQKFECTYCMYVCMDACLICNFPTRHPAPSDEDEASRAERAKCAPCHMDIQVDHVRPKVYRCMACFASTVYVFLSVAPMPRFRKMEEKPCQPNMTRFHEPDAETF